MAAAAIDLDSDENESGVSFAGAEVRPPTFFPPQAPHHAACPDVRCPDNFQHFDSDKMFRKINTNKDNLHYVTPRPHGFRSVRNVMRRSFVQVRRYLILF